MDIRQCREQDLPLLEAGNPSPGQTRYHDRRFQRQQQGASTFLIAWAGGVPVGTGEILWRGCAAPEVHQRYPHCPELNGLHVWPAERRSHGIGTAIIRAAEALARDRGCPQGTATRHQPPGAGTRQPRHPFRRLRQLTPPERPERSAIGSFWLGRWGCVWRWRWRRRRSTGVPGRGRFARKGRQGRGGACGRCRAAGRRGHRLPRW
jgi:GNAT superfamily N-acetyltransferase